MNFRYIPRSPCLYQPYMQLPSFRTLRVCPCDHTEGFSVGGRHTLYGRRDNCKSDPQLLILPPPRNHNRSKRKGPDPISAGFRGVSQLRGDISRGITGSRENFLSEILYHSSSSYSYSLLLLSSLHSSSYPSLHYSSPESSFLLKYIYSSKSSSLAWFCSS